MYTIATRRGFLTLLAAAAGNARTPIRVGCQTRCFGNPPKTLAALLPLLDDIGAAGYHGFETNHIILSSMQEPSNARPEIEKRLPLIGLHLGVPLHREDLAEQNRGQIARVAQGVRSMGGDHLMLSGAASRDLQGAALRPALRRKSEELIQAARKCRELKVRVCCHNHVEETQNDFAELREILANTPPEVWLLLDIGHAGISGAAAAVFFREHFTRIAGLHVRDRVGDQQVPMGTGKVDLRGVGKAILDTGWSGWVIVELEGKPVPSVSNSQGIRLARTFLKTEWKI